MGNTPLIAKVYKMVTQKSSTKPRMAIISTYDDLCGIAGYTRGLISYLSEEFETEVLDLDQFLMRSTNGAVAKLADQQIRDFCARLKDFDAVNIQLEYGTLGYYDAQVLKRFKWLVDAAPAVSVTFHTVLITETYPSEHIVAALLKFELWNAYNMVRGYHKKRKFREKVYETLRLAQNKKRVAAIVHSPESSKEMRFVHGLKSVFDHPLSFLPVKQARRILSQTSSKSFPGLVNLPKGAKILGVFGFVNEYKGIHTALRALRELPDNYHLAIFGGLHPHEIVRSTNAHPYVDRLLAEIDGPPITRSTETTDVISRAEQKSFRERVHFIGTLSDDDLAKAMAVSDVAILPYFEVGQTSSGPMSMALEMGASIIAARTRAFLQFAGYHPDQFQFFEIGNYLELAQKIQSMPQGNRGIPNLEYSTETNLKIYVDANSAKHPKP